MTSELCLEGCEGKYRPRENIVICSRSSTKFAKVLCHMTRGHISARWERELIQSNQPSGTGEVETEASWVRKDRDPICVSESLLRGQVEDRAEGETGNGETKFAAGGDKKRAWPGSYVQGQKYHSFLSFILLVCLNPQ